MYNLRSITGCDRATTRCLPNRCQCQATRSRCRRTRCRWPATKPPKAQSIQVSCVQFTQTFDSGRNRTGDPRANSLTSASYELLRPIITLSRGGKRSLKNLTWAFTWAKLRFLFISLIKINSIPSFGYYLLIYNRQLGRNFTFC